MNLSKIPNDKKLELCRWYFRGEFSMHTSTFKLRTNKIQAMFDGVTQVFQYSIR